MYVKDFNEQKYQFLIEKGGNVKIKDLNDPKAFIECWNTMDDVYKDINEYNLTRKRKSLNGFDNMIADIMTNRKFVKEFFIRSRKLNISLVFIIQANFSVRKDVKLNSTHYLIIKICNKKELQNIATNHSAHTDSKDFMEICGEWLRAF